MKALSSACWGGKKTRMCYFLCSDGGIFCLSGAICLIASEVRSGAFWSNALICFHVPSALASAPCRVNSTSNRKTTHSSRFCSRSLQFESFQQWNLRFIIMSALVFSFSWCIFKTSLLSLCLEGLCSLLGGFALQSSTRSLLSAWVLWQNWCCNTRTRRTRVSQPFKGLWVLILYSNTFHWTPDLWYSFTSLCVLSSFAFHEFYQAISWDPDNFACIASHGLQNLSPPFHGKASSVLDFESGWELSSGGKAPSAFFMIPGCTKQGAAHSLSGFPFWRLLGCVSSTAAPSWDRCSRGWVLPWWAEQSSAAAVTFRLISEINVI